MSLKLIETYLPLDALAQAAANEMRAGKGSPSSLHLWWGNRQTAIAKGLLFAQLVDAPDFGDVKRTVETREVLNGLLNGDPLVEPKAREMIRESCDDDWPTVHDPFCGIGTIPFSALCLGVPSSGGELNPLAAFVTRLAIGDSRSNLTPLDVKRAIAWVDAAAKRTAAANYPDIKVSAAMARDRPEIAKYVGRTLPVEMWLWVRTVPDPNPAFSEVNVPLCTNFVTGAKKGRESWVEPVLLKSKKGYSFKIHSGLPSSGAEYGTRQGRADFRSIIDGNLVSADYIREAGRAGKLGARMMAVFAAGDEGEHLVLPVTKSQETAAQVMAECFPSLSLPGNVRDCAPVNFGAKTYGDLFLPRQRVALSAISSAICEYARKGDRERCAARVLTLAFSNFLSWHSTANTYWNQRQFPRNVFTRQAIHQTWDFVEANPFFGSLKRWEEIAHASADNFFGLQRIPAGRTVQADARTGFPDEKVVVNTELPYYDNIAYADLADFFYGWVRPCMEAVDPDLATSEASPRDDELTAFAYRHGGKDEANRFYRVRMSETLRKIAAHVREDYPAVFSFDFRSATFSGRDAEPMTAFAEGLVKAGFTITATWPLKDIRPRAVFGGEAGAGFRNIYFICRKRRVNAKIVGRREFVERLTRVLPQGLKTFRVLDRNLESADYAPAALGVGLRFYSEYEKILNPDGNEFGVGDVLAEVLKAVEAIRASETAESSAADDASACRKVEEELRNGGDAEALRRKAFAAYDKAESEGRLEDAAAWNELLNRWNDLTEDTTR